MNAAMYGAGGRKRSVRTAADVDLLVSEVTAPSSYILSAKRVLFYTPLRPFRLYFRFGNNGQLVWRYASSCAVSDPPSHHASAPTSPLLKRTHKKMIPDIKRIRVGHNCRVAACEKCRPV